MKFLDWLFGRDSKGPEEVVELHPVDLALGLGPKEEVPPKPKFKKVPKWTHAGKKGKSVYCPECGASVRVFNFAWASLICKSCGADADKYEWLLAVDGDE